MRREEAQEHRVGSKEERLPAYSEEGVDLTLIRWMLSLTPAERLDVLQRLVNATHRLRNVGANTSDAGNADDTRTCIIVEDRFIVVGNAALIIYRLLSGEVQSGMEIASQDYGDRWRAIIPEGFFDPPPCEGFVRPPALILRPLNALREIQVGEVFCSAE